MRTLRCYRQEDQEHRDEWHDLMLSNDGSDPLRQMLRKLRRADMAHHRHAAALRVQRRRAFVHENVHRRHHGCLRQPELKVVGHLRGNSHRVRFSTRTAPAPTFL